jgi:hypothetical protein
MTAFIQGHVDLLIDLSCLLWLAWLVVRPEGKPPSVAVVPNLRLHGFGVAYSAEGGQ